MTNKQRSMMRKVPAALAVLAAGAMYAMPASALVELDFRQSSGFYSGDDTAGPPCTLLDICVAKLLALGNGSAVASQGGFDMFNLVSPPAGVPPADSYPAYKQAAWGCAGGFTDCANDANASTPDWTATNGWTIEPYPFAPDAPAPRVRSSLEVLGQYGDGTTGHPRLNDATWETLTIVTHHNRDIDGNVLDTIDVVSWTELVPTVPGLASCSAATPCLPEGTAPTKVHVDFQETKNHPTPETDAACKAVADNKPLTNATVAGQPPINPLQSVCDDFAVIARSDLIPGDVPLPGLKIAFRLVDANPNLAPPDRPALVCDGTATQDALCAPYNGTDIVLYTRERSSNTILIQAKLVPDTFGGCTYTQGYWKTHSTYGPAKKADAGWLLIDPDGDTNNEGPNETFFASSQTWLQNFRTPPKGGNAFYILSHQYMAAVLNVASGASPVSLGTTLAQAGALLSSYSAAKEIPKKSANRAIAINLAGILGSFNEGTLPGGPEHCSEDPTPPA